MSQLIVDAAMRAKLAPLKERVELRDEAGEVLGDFIPKAAVKPLIPWEPDVTRDEIDRRAREPGRSWAEIKQRLEQMRSL